MDSLEAKGKKKVKGIKKNKKKGTSCLIEAFRGIVNTKITMFKRGGTVEITVETATHYSMERDTGGDNEPHMELETYSDNSTKRCENHRSLSLFIRRYGRNHYEADDFIHGNQKQLERMIKKVQDAL